MYSETQPPPYIASKCWNYQWPNISEREAGLFPEEKTFPSGDLQVGCDYYLAERATNTRRAPSLGTCRIL